MSDYIDYGNSDFRSVIDVIKQIINKIKFELDNDLKNQ